jgi:ACDE family multidrug resistance protein
VSVAERILQRVFGTEGDVATEPEMQLVIMATATAVTGVFVVSPIVSHLAEPFGVPKTAVGQLITAFTAPSVVLTPFMGILTDRVGRKPVLFVGLIVFGLAGTGVVLTTSFLVALTLRAMQGIGYAAVMPVGVVILGDLYANDREATAQGLRSAGIQTMVLISPLLAGVLVLGSWRYPFVLFLLAIGVAVWAWQALPDTSATANSSFHAYGTNLVALLRKPVMISLLFTFTLRFFLSFGFFAYVSVLLTQEFGSSAVVAGLLVSTYGLVSLVAATQTGRLITTHDGLLIMLVGFVLGGIGMMGIGLATSLLAVVAGVVLLAVGMGVISPVQKSIVTQRSPQSLRAGAVSTALIFQSIGQTAGPFFVGLVGGWISIATAFTGVGLIGVTVGGLLLVPAYRRDRDTDLIK